jgi:hypothetical protein
MPHPATRCDSGFARLPRRPRCPLPRPLHLASRPLRPLRPLHLVAPAAPAAPPGCPANPEIRSAVSRPAGRPRSGLCGVWSDFVLLAGLIMGGAGRGVGGGSRMPGMKITLDSAMRARDVSRPRPEHEAAAELINEGTSARPRPPHAEGSRSAPVRTGAPETSRPGPPAPRMAPGAARSAATSESTTASVPSSRRGAPAQPPSAAAQPNSPGLPKTPGQNRDAGRGRGGGRGKRHRTRKRGGR